MKINLAADRRPPTADRRPPPVAGLPPSRRGMALVITLILLSVTLVMAVACLAMSRRERGAVTTATDTTQARLAADSALAAAQAQIVANVLATTNGLYDFHLLSSTNFLPVGYDQFAIGNVLPRPIVMMTNLTLHSNESRFYLDLNRNGRDDPGTASIAGDPEWIGVLERPDLNPGPNNRFVARYAFFAQPVGNTLDLNYIHNEAGNRVVDSYAGQLGVQDSFLRNQGVGSWELNLAGFLNDLNPNQWNQYSYNPPPAVGGNSGADFDDARSLLSWRYGYNYLLQATANSYFTTNFANYPYGIDVYSDGPLQTTVDVTPPLDTAATVLLPWAGSDNTNRFFALPSELFDASKSSSNFVSRLTNAINFDSYTFYRLLDQIGTDTTADDPRMNLNYDNLDTNGVVIAGAETNFIAWSPLRFFTNAANRLLTNYTARWLAADSNNYMATFNVKTPICLTNIPVLVSNRFVYSPAVNRLLQLAANIYDATTNNAPALGKNYPSVFRPTFWVTNENNSTNVYINGYTYVSTVGGPGDLAYFSQPWEASALAAAVTGPVANNVNVFDVPWIIGAKKGFPGFNQFSMANVITVTRKLQVHRPDLSHVNDATNQMYIFCISNVLGCSLWNSYTNDYIGNITIHAQNNFNGLITNDASGLVFTPFQILSTNIFATNPATAWSWKGADLRAGPLNGPDATMPPDITNSFVIAFNTNVAVLTNAIYRYALSGYGGNPNPHFQDGDMSGWQNNVSTPPLPQFSMMLTNQLQVFILDQIPGGDIHVIDYVHFTQSTTNENINRILADSDSNNGNPAYMWSTNLVGGVPSGVLNQLAVSQGTATPAPNIPDYWVAPKNMPNTLPQTPPVEQAFFSGAFRPNGAFRYPVNTGPIYYNSNLVNQAPYVPTRILYKLTVWQANDPLVHYLASDLKYTVPGQFGWERKDQAYEALQGVVPLNLNRDPTVPIVFKQWHYSPWGDNAWLTTYPDTVDKNNPYNLQYKDPQMWRSDYWDFPTNKFPTPGWLGRVHRGTPWQTVYLKSTDVRDLTNANNRIGDNTWVQWTGNTNGFGFDATNAVPVTDRYLFDLFTTKVNDNGRRGTLPVNVGSGGSDPARGLAAWSALFSGMVVMSNTASGITPIVISPAGTGGITNSAVGWMVTNINFARTNMVNFDGVKEVFEHIGDVLRSPLLTEQSPFLDLKNNTNYLSDEVYEWLPQQSLGLLRLGAPPRYVIYCYGQALRPAPNSVNLVGGANFGTVTNYQVVAESAARAVLRVNQNVFTNAVGAAIGTNYSTTIESYNVLGPD